VQFNKRDDPNALNSSEIAKELGVNGFPTFESVATKGDGVFETLKSIIGSVMTNLQRELTKA
jgi:hypothetical protein